MMTINQVLEYLEEHKTQQQSQFSSKLIPGSKPILGVKIPVLRTLAKQIAKEDYQWFLKECPNTYFELESLQAFVIGYAKDDVNTILEFADDFVPKIHDWSVNDSFCQTFSIARNHRAEVYDWLMKYKRQEKEYSQRMVAVLFMSHFLVDDYIDLVLDCMNQLQFDAYYTKMGVAWCVATAYAKFPVQTKAFMQHNSLDDWTYNKAIQKMLESYRVSDQDKEMLRGWKR